MKGRTLTLLLALMAITAFALGALLVGNPLDGDRKSDILHFIGRFHPTVLHLPIAFLLLLALLETLVFKDRFNFLRASIPLVLTLSIISVLAAVSTGFLLAYASGSNEPLVVEHMKTSLYLAIAALGLGIFKLYWEKPFAKIAYRSLLLASLALLASTSHDGGTLTHGRGYLTKYMPNSIRPLFGLQVEGTPDAESASDLIVFKDIIHPIIDQNCVSCHNPDKLKGELNLETYAGHLKGGELGPAITPGDPDNSEIVFRITLPEDDDEFMPPDGKTPLKKNEVEIINWWIQSGASETATVSQYHSIPAPIDQYIATVFENILTPEEIEARKSKKTALYESLQSINRELGILITPYQSEAARFVIDTFSVQNRFDQNMLMKIEPFATSIVEADFSGTALTDESFETLSKFSNLRTLNLSRTSVTGESIESLKRINSLETLNLYGTQIKSEHIDKLSQLTQLKHLFLFQTELYSNETISLLRSALPNCEINLVEEAI